MYNMESLFLTHAAIYMYMYLHVIVSWIIIMFMLCVECHGDLNYLRIIMYYYIIMHAT